MARSEAMLYDDYIKIRDAKIGDTVVLSDGTEIIKKKMTESEAPIGVHHSHPTCNMGLDYYDGSRND